MYRFPKNLYTDVRIETVKTTKKKDLRATPHDGGEAKVGLSGAFPQRKHSPIL